MYIVIKKRQVYRRLIALVTASFFFLSIFTSDVLALAPELRTKPFSESTKLEFELVAKMMSAAGEIRGLIEADNARENPIMRLNELYFPGGEVEIETTLKDGALTTSRREYKAALFHFKKTNKTIEARFFKDAKLNSDELIELGVKTDKDKNHFFNSPEYPVLRGVWFVNPEKKRENRPVPAKPSQNGAIPERDTLQASSHIAGAMAQNGPDAIADTGSISQDGVAPRGPFLSPLSSFSNGVIIAEIERFRREQGKRIIQVTGLQGSGKTTSSDYLMKKHNFYLLRVERVVIEKISKDLSDKMRAIYGNEIIDDKGRLNIGMLYEDINLFRRYLEDAVPAAQTEIMTEILQAFQKGYDSVVVEFVLPVEPMTSLKFDDVIFIDRPADDLLKAINSRDDHKEIADLISKVLLTMPPPEEYLRNSTYRIVNIGSLDELYQFIDRIVAQSNKKGLRNLVKNGAIPKSLASERKQQTLGMIRHPESDIESGDTLQPGSHIAGAMAQNGPDVTADTDSVSRDGVAPRGPSLSSTGDRVSINRTSVDAGEAPKRIRVIKRPGYSEKRTAEEMYSFRQNLIQYADEWQNKPAVRRGMAQEKVWTYLTNKAIKNVIYPASRIDVITVDEIVNTIKTVTDVHLVDICVDMSLESIISTYLTIFTEILKFKIKSTDEKLFINRRASGDDATFVIEASFKEARKKGDHYAIVLDDENNERSVTLHFYYDDYLEPSPALASLKGKMDLIVIKHPGFSGRLSIGGMSLTERSFDTSFYLSHPGTYFYLADTPVPLQKGLFDRLDLEATNFYTSFAEAVPKKIPGICSFFLADKEFLLARVNDRLLENGAIPKSLASERKQQTLGMIRHPESDIEPGDTPQAGSHIAGAMAQNEPDEIDATGSVFRDGVKRKKPFLSSALDLSASSSRLECPVELFKYTTTTPLSDIYGEFEKWHIVSSPGSSNPIVIDQYQFYQAVPILRHLANYAENKNTRAALTRLLSNTVGGQREDILPRKKIGANTKLPIHRTRGNSTKSTSGTPPGSDLEASQSASTEKPSSRIAGAMAQNEPDVTDDTGSVFRDGVAPRGPSLSPLSPHLNSFVFGEYTTLENISEYLYWVRHKKASISAANSQSIRNETLVAVTQLRDTLRKMSFGRSKSHEPCINCLNSGRCMIVDALMAGKFPGKESKHTSCGTKCRISNEDLRSAIDEVSHLCDELDRPDIESLEFIGRGADSTVYRDGDRVFKVYAGHDEERIRVYKNTTDRVKEILISCSGKDTLTLCGTTYWVIYQVNPIRRIFKQGSSVLAESRFINGVRMSALFGYDGSMLEKALAGMDEEKKRTYKNIMSDKNYIMSMKSLLSRYSALIGDDIGMNGITLSSSDNIVIDIDPKTNKITLTITDICSAIDYLNPKVAITEEVVPHNIRLGDKAPIAPSTYNVEAGVESGTLSKLASEVSPAPAEGTFLGLELKTFPSASAEKPSSRIAGAMAEDHTGRTRDPEAVRTELRKNFGEYFEGILYELGLDEDEVLASRHSFRNFLLEELRKIDTKDIKTVQAFRKAMDAVLKKVRGMLKDRYGNDKPVISELDRYITDRVRDLEIDFNLERERISSEIESFDEQRAAKWTEIEFYVRQRIATANQSGQNVQGVIVFDSWARGVSRASSDIDCGIVINESADPSFSIDDFGRSLQDASAPCPIKYIFAGPVKDMLPLYLMLMISALDIKPAWKIIACDKDSRYKIEKMMLDSWDRYVREDSTGLKYSSMIAGAMAQNEPDEIADTGSVSQDGVARNLSSEARRTKEEAATIHAENMKRENMPAIAPQAMLCHIITDSILPSDQRNMLKVSVDQAMDKANKHIERIASLSGENAASPDKFIEDLRALMDRKRAEYAKLGYTNVRFTVACPDVGLVDKVLGSGLDIKALAFKPCDGLQFNVTQPEGIMLALRALDSGDLGKLKSVFTFLARRALSDQEAAITDLATFIRRVVFELPAARVEDYERRRIYHTIANYIWQAA